MEESILVSIKKLLGLTEEYTAFDTDVIIHINSVFMILNQLGVGPDEPFRITGDSETRSDFTTAMDVEAVKSYVYLKVRLIFDPPMSSAVKDAVKSTIDELEWRLNVQVDPDKEGDTE